MAIPQTVENLLKKRFNYPDRMIFAQVATLSENGPDLRTMGLFNIDDEGRLIFLTNTFSHKWTQISSHPKISVLLLNPEQNVQIIARGLAETMTPLTAPELSAFYWNLTPEGAKQTYALQDPENKYVPIIGKTTPSHPPKNFGIIRITPTIWEFLEMDLENYPASPRFRYIKTNTTWQEKRLNAI